MSRSTRPDEVALDPGTTVPSRLTAALLLWGPEGGYKPTFARLHRIRPGPKDTLRVDPNGSPLDAEELRRIALSLSATADRGMTALVRDGRVLFEREPLVVWWRPPQRTHVFFNCPELGGHIKGVVPLPGLVFAGCGTRLRIVALKGPQRPNDATPTFVAPFFNHYADALVCNGSVDLTTESATSIDDVERAYFGSAFTHPNQRATHTRYRDGIFALWRDLLDGTLRTFPEASLAPYPEGAKRDGTVASFIKDNF